MFASRTIATETRDMMATVQAMVTCHVSFIHHHLTLVTRLRHKSSLIPLMRCLVHYHLNHVSYIHQKFTLFLYIVNFSISFDLSSCSYNLNISWKKCWLSLHSNQMLAYNWQLGSDGLVVVGGWRRPCSLSGVGGWDGEYRMKCYDGGVGSWWQQVTQHGRCHVNIHMPDINIGHCHIDKLVDINIIGIFSYKPLDISIGVIL